MTYCLIALCFLFFLWPRIAGIPEPGFLRRWGAIPNEIAYHRHWTGLITSMFLHSGWFHLLGNLWFLFIFGDNVEDRLGRWRYVAFYGVTGISGALAQIALAPHATVPMVGASGAIAGVMGGYFVLFPNNTVKTYFGINRFGTVVDAPAFLVIALWIAAQAFLAAFAGDTSIAYPAHVGGFLAGVVLLLPLSYRARGGPGTVPVEDDGFKEEMAKPLSPLYAGTAIGLVLLVSVGFGHSKLRQADIWAQCAGDDPTMSIPACTAYIANTSDSSDQSNAYRARGLAYLDTGHSQSAIADLRQAVTLWPASVNARMSLGWAYYSTSRYDSAIEEYSSAIRHNRQNSAAYVGRGLSYLAVRRYDKAMADCGTALRLESGNAGAWSCRGKVYYAKSDFDRAIPDFNKAVELRPDAEYTWIDRANALIQQGQYELALKSLDRAVALPNASRNAFWRRGQAQFFLGRFRQAEADIAKSIDVSKPSPYRLFWKHLAARRAGDSSTTLTVHGAPWEESIGAFLAGRMTAIQLRAAARIPGADTAEEQACVAEFYIGEMALIRGDTAEARERFRTTLRTCPGTFVEYEGASAENRRLRR